MLPVPGRSSTPSGAISPTPCIRSISHDRSLFSAPAVLDAAFAPCSVRAAARARTDNRAHAAGAPAPQAPSDRARTRCPGGRGTAPLRQDSRWKAPPPRWTTPHLAASPRHTTGSGRRPCRAASVPLRNHLVQQQHCPEHVLSLCRLHGINSDCHVALKGGSNMTSWL